MTDALPPVIELIVAVFVLLGAGFVFVGSLGLVRLADFYCRLHGPSKSTTLGLGGILIGSAVYFTTRGATSLHEVLITFFLFITTPVSAHLLAKAALHLRLPPVSGAPAGQVTPPGEPSSVVTQLPTSETLPADAPAAQAEADAPMRPAGD